VKELEPTGAPRRGLRGAWWVAVAVAVFFVAVAVVQIREVLESREREIVGDAEDPATYGFDLANLSVPRHVLAAAMTKDHLEPLPVTRLLSAVQVDSLNKAERGKYLVPDDRVIGVVVGGVARAYPVRVLDWHEVANDTVGGVPVAVCWHPLSGAAVVLDRRVGGEVLSFGISGLVWNSHHLLYDRRPGAGGESLWVPLLARAVSGPALGDTLEVVPSALTTWERWRLAFPATTVPFPEPAMRAAYKRDPYGAYGSSDLLRYPVADLPPLKDGQQLKDMMHVGASPAAVVPTFAQKHAFRFAVLALDLR
jgi:hypothetical protein